MDSATINAVDSAVMNAISERGIMLTGGEVVRQLRRLGYTVVPIESGEAEAPEEIHGHTAKCRESDFCICKYLESSMGRDPLSDCPTGRTDCWCQTDTAGNEGEETRIYRRGGFP